MSEELPVGWASTALNNLFSKIRGVSYSKEESSSEPLAGYVSILRANNIQDDHLEFSDLVWVAPNRVSDLQRIQGGDILIAMSSGSKSVVGKTAQAMESWDGAFGAFCAVLRPCKEIDQRYLGFFLRTAYYRQKISDLSAGSNINNLKDEHFSEITVPVAPLPEQRRIVAKLEALLAKVDASRKSLERIPVTLKRFSQAVLAAACDGRLTEDWREANAKPGTESWATKQMRELFLVRTGGTPSRKENQYYAGGTIPWVKTGEVQNGPITSTSEFITPVAVSESNAKIFPAGTILIALYGDGKTRGQVGRLTFPAATNQACAALLSDSLSEITFQYVFNFWLSQYQRLRDESAGGNQQNLNLGIIKDWVISLPPEDEQAEIVRRTKDLLALADQIEARYAKAKAQVDRLTQSILAKAFQGELVPQDPNDPPAEVLLSRLAAVPDEASAPARRRGRPPHLQPAALPVVPVAIAEDREAPALADLTPEAIRQAHREVLASISSPLSEDNLLRAVALRLGFQRLGGRIKARIKETLSTTSSFRD